MPHPASATVTRRTPPRLWFLAAVAAGVYPLITTILYVVVPLTEGWAIWQRTLVIVPVMVPAMVFGLMPVIHRLVGRPH